MTIQRSDIGRALQKVLAGESTAGAMDLTTALVEAP
jgi:hypothetical protein